jgi:hypothetical protein
MNPQRPPHVENVLHIQKERCIVEGSCTVCAEKGHLASSCPQNFKTTPAASTWIPTLPPWRSNQVKTRLPPPWRMDQAVRNRVLRVQDRTSEQGRGEMGWTARDGESSDWNQRGGHTRKDQNRDDGFKTWLEQKAVTGQLPVERMVGDTSREDGFWRKEPQTIPFIPAGDHVPSMDDRYFTRASEDGKSRDREWTRGRRDAQSGDRARRTDGRESWSDRKDMHPRKTRTDGDSRHDQGDTRSGRSSTHRRRHLAESRSRSGPRRERSRERDLSWNRREPDRDKRKSDGDDKRDEGEGRLWRSSGHRSTVDIESRRHSPSTKARRQKNSSAPNCTEARDTSRGDQMTRKRKRDLRSEDRHRRSDDQENPRERRGWAEAEDDTPRPRSTYRTSGQSHSLDRPLSHWDPRRVTGAEQDSSRDERYTYRPRRTSRTRSRGHSGDRPRTPHKYRWKRSAERDSSTHGGDTWHSR